MPVVNVTTGPPTATRNLFGFSHSGSQAPAGSTRGGGLPRVCAISAAPETLVRLHRGGGAPSSLTRPQEEVCGWRAGWRAALACFAVESPGRWLGCWLWVGRSAGSELPHSQRAARRCPSLWVHSRHVEEQRVSLHTGFLASTMPFSLCQSPSPSGSISPPPRIWAAYGSENSAE